MFGWVMTTEGWAALVSLAALEIVLGIDNVIFISLLVAKLPATQAARARSVGLLLALGMRIALLFALTAIIALTAPLFNIMGQGVSWRDIILFAGGAFLIVKATHEIHVTMEGEPEHGTPRAQAMSFGGAIAQIAVIDLVFSIDSIITAVGMSQNVEVMIAAVLIAVAVMYVASGPLSAFIERHPTTKVLALAFLLLVGLALVIDATGLHLPRGYIYGAMAFAALVEALNLVGASRRKGKSASTVGATPAHEPPTG